MSSRRPHLSVVIPAYNEAERLPPTLDRIADYFATEGVDYEVVVSDDGSTDKTVAVAESHLRKGLDRVLAQVENRGKGAAVRAGVHGARGRWLLLCDADLSTPIEEYAKLAAVARDHDRDIVIGSRGLVDSDIEERQSAVRQLMGKTFNVILRAMTALPFRDTQCGFKLLDSARVKPLFDLMVIDRFAFDVELLLLARRFKLTVEELPIVWRNKEHSRVNMLLDPPNMLMDVARVRWRMRTGGYNPAPPAP